MITGASSTTVVALGSRAHSGATRMTRTSRKRCRCRGSRADNGCRPGQRVRSGEEARDDHAPEEQNKRSEAAADLVTSCGEKMPATIRAPTPSKPATAMSTTSKAIARMTAPNAEGQRDLKTCHRRPSINRTAAHMMPPSFHGRFSPRSIRSGLARRGCARRSRRSCRTPRRRGTTSPARGRGLERPSGDSRQTLQAQDHLAEEIFERTGACGGAVSPCCSAMMSTLSTQRTMVVHCSSPRRTTGARGSREISLGQDVVALGTAGRAHAQRPKRRILGRKRLAAAFEKCGHLPPTSVSSTSGT